MCPIVPRAAETNILVWLFESILIHKQRFRFETLYFIFVKNASLSIVWTFEHFKTLPKLKENSLEAQRGKV